MLGYFLSRAMRMFGDRPAIRLESGDQDWAELIGRVSALASQWRARGLQPGDRIALLARNSPEYLGAYYAAAWGGFVIVPLNTRSHADEMSFWITDSGARLLVHDSAFAPLAAHLSSGIDGLELSLLDLPPRLSTLVDFTPRQPGDVAAIYYTGGTTGRSKGVALTHGNLHANALQCFALFGYRSDTVFLHAAPMFHLADGASNFMLALAGACHSFLADFDLNGLIAATERDRITALVLVPTMVQRLADHPGLDPHRLRSLDTIQYGGAPMQAGTLERARELFPAVSFVQCYGMTELSPVATILSREDHRRAASFPHRLRSVGQPVPGIELRIVHPDGREAAVDEKGEIAVRSATVMAGYWRQAELTEQAIRGGWMYTGDLGSIDADGYVYLHDRIKDMIISGGENIYSAEVENILSTHPDIAQCAVIGVPSPDWGEIVHAVVVPRDGALLEVGEVIAFCRDRLTAYKCPKTVEFRTALPLTGAGKVQKAALRAERVAGLA
jgi:long-chain acyl-CoA synthetase